MQYVLESASKILKIVKIENQERAKLRNFEASGVKKDPSWIDVSLIISCFTDFDIDIKIFEFYRFSFFKIRKSLNFRELFEALGIRHEIDVWSSFHG